MSEIFGGYGAAVSYLLQDRRGTVGQFCIHFLVRWLQKLCFIIYFECLWWWLFSPILPLSQPFSAFAAMTKEGNSTFNSESNSNKTRSACVYFSLHLGTFDWILYPVRTVQPQQRQRSWQQQAGSTLLTQMRLVKYTVLLQLSVATDRYLCSYSLLQSTTTVRTKASNGVL